MKHFIDIKDISVKNLRTIIENSKKEKKENLNTIEKLFLKINS